MYKEIIREIGIENYRDLFRAVYEMDAVEIISMYEPLEETKKTGVYSGLCPFHSEKSKGAFSVHRRYNGNATGGYYCFGCGAKGNGVTYVKEKFFGSTADNRDAVLKIAQDKGILIVGGGPMKTKEYVKKEILPMIELHPTKDINWRDRVYRLFLECCPLHDEDREYLKTYRGLTDEQIDRGGYRSAPNRSVLFTEGDQRITSGFKSFTTALSNATINKEDLLGIPGFYLEEKDIKGKKHSLITFTKLSGILIPCRNVTGQIQAIQIDPKAKIKENWKGPKYFWWSSSNADGVTSEKESCGSKAGAPVGVVYPKELTSSSIYITEGYYKAEAIAETFGAIVITLQGVGNWVGIEDILIDIELSEYFQEKYNGIKEIGVAFDGDMLYNYAVYTQLRKMTNIIKEVLDGKIYYICWDTKKGKGIDDVLLENENPIQILRRVHKQSWDTFYSLCTQRICTNLNIESPLDIPAMKFKKAIIQEVRQHISISKSKSRV